MHYLEGKRVISYLAWMVVSFKKTFKNLHNGWRQNLILQFTHEVVKLRVLFASHLRWPVDWGNRDLLQRRKSANYRLNIFFWFIVYVLEKCRVFVRCILCLGKEREGENALKTSSLEERPRALFCTAAENKSGDARRASVSLNVRQCQHGWLVWENSTEREHFSGFIKPG